MKATMHVIFWIGVCLSLPSAGSLMPARGHNLAEVGAPAPSWLLLIRSTQSGDMDTVDLDAARLALAALRASLPQQQRTDDERVVLAPDVEVLSFDAVATRLAGKPKPLECRAHAADGTLVVSCSDVSAEWRAIHNNQVEDINSSEGPIGALRTSTDESATEKVLVLGKEQSLLVPIGALEAWARDYVITLQLGVTSRAADGAEKALGVRSVIEFGHVEEVDARSETARQLFEFRRSYRPSTG